MALPCILLIGTCDTKLTEISFVRSQLLKLGGSTVKVVDVGRTNTINEIINVTNAEVLSHLDPTPDVSAMPRGDVIKTMISACTIVVRKMFESQSIHGMIAIGGSGGTSLASGVMREALPFGFPKLILSTMASGDTSSFVGETDITLMPSVVDVAGLNSMLRPVLENAAGAIHGMAQAYFERSKVVPENNTASVTERGKKHRIALSMFGVTTPCVTAASNFLADLGHETFVFHATGAGGRAMERLIVEGHFDGVLDITTTELADELVGGVLTAGPDRLTAAAKRGVPQIVSVGALDMVNFGPKASVPAKWNDRKFFIHNPDVTLMRTTPEECKLLGQELAKNLEQNSTDGKKVEVWLPTRGISILSVTGGHFEDGDADKALFDAIERSLSGSEIGVVKRETDINDPDFALSMAKRLVELMG